MLWWTYLPEVGREARQWCSDYELYGKSIALRAGLVARRLQSRRLEGARAELRDCQKESAGLAPYASASTRSVVRTILLAAEAYYYYHLGMAHEARLALFEARGSISEAIESSPFLAPLAGYCYDYCLHFARIARGECKWDEMWRSIEEGRLMVQSKVPLCVTSKSEIYLKDVCSFYRTATPLNELEAVALRKLSDEGEIGAQYESICLWATVIPFVVLDWGR